jgi:hypothetical protein
MISCSSHSVKATPPLIDTVVTPSRFLQLPRELRNLIYDHFWNLKREYDFCDFLHEHNDIEYYIRRYPNANIQFGNDDLLRSILISRQICNEALEVLFIRTTVIASVPDRARSPQPKANQKPQPVADIFDIVPLIRALRLKVCVCSESLTQMIGFNEHTARHIMDMGYVLRSAGRLKKLGILLDCSMGSYMVNEALDRHID